MTVENNVSFPAYPEFHQCLEEKIGADKQFFNQKETVEYVAKKLAQREIKVTSVERRVLWGLCGDPDNDEAPMSYTMCYIACQESFERLKRAALQCTTTDRIKEQIQTQSKESLQQISGSIKTENSFNSIYPIEKNCLKKNENQECENQFQRDLEDL